MSNLDPNGPAALLHAAIGRTPPWCHTEEDISNDYGPGWRYAVKTIGELMMQELTALTSIGLRITIRPNRIGLDIRIFPPRMTHDQDGLAGDVLTRHKQHTPNTEGKP